MTPKRFSGYHEPSSLPFRRGQEVVIPKGVKVRSMHPSRSEFVTARQMQIKIHHFNSGQSIHFRLMSERDRHFWSAVPEVADLMSSLYRESELLRTYEGPDSFERHRALCDAVVPTMNPAVCWPGSSGYWNRADVNDILEANGIPLAPEQPEASEGDAETALERAL